MILGHLALRHLSQIAAVCDSADLLTKRA